MTARSASTSPGRTTVPAKLRLGGLFPGWCSGSTRGFGPLGLGSIPRPGATAPQIAL